MDACCSTGRLTAYRWGALGLIAAWAGLLASCGHFDAGLTVWQANRQVAASDYNQALALYLGLEAASLPPSERPGLLQYNTATVYARLGEDQAAQGLFEQAARSQNPELASLALHNLGPLLYGQADYAGALAAWRSSLERHPGRPETVRAYEAAWRLLQTQADIRADRERSGYQPGVGGNFGMFAVSSSAARALFTSGGLDANASQPDH